MNRPDWVSIGEYESALQATPVSSRLTIEGIPHRIIHSPFRRDRSCSIWVPPDIAGSVKTMLAKDAIPEDELADEAMSYPPPDDA